MIEALSDIPTMHLVALVVTSVLAALVQGALGFGFAIVSVPFLLLVDERLAPVPQLIASLFFCVRIWWREREAVQLRGVIMMSLGRLPGTYLGYLLLFVASAAVLDLVIGALVLLAVFVLAGRKAVARNDVTQLVAGAASGAAAYVSAIGGPPIALLYKGAKGAEVRANVSLVFVIGGVITIGGRVLGGDLTALDIYLGLLAVPAGFLGVWLSGLVKDHIEGRPMQIGILLMCSLAALALFARAGGLIPRALHQDETVVEPLEGPVADSTERRASAAQRSPGAPAARLPAVGEMNTARAVEAPDASIEGVVVDASSGEGIAGARLVFVSDRERMLVISDAEGRFSLRFDEPGTYALASAGAPGFVPIDGSVMALRVEARPGWRIEGVRVPLEPEATLDGRTVDGEGEPVPDATVTVLGRGGDRSVRSDAEGRFRVNAPLDSVLEATAAVGSGRTRVDRWSELTRRITIVLREDAEVTGSVAGVVVAADGTRVAGAPVDLRFEGPPGEDATRIRPSRQTRTDAEGHFAFERVLPGAYTVESSVEGWGAAEVRGVESPAGDVRLVLGSEARITGQVVGSGGSPLAAAVVVVQRVDGALARWVAVRAVLDAEGRFAIGGLMPGAHRVSALAPGFAPSPGRDVTLDVGDNALEPLVLANGGVLTGVVTDGSTAAPIEGARVFVEGAGAPTLEQSARTDAEGRYRIEGVGPSVHAIDAHAAGYHVRVLAGLEPMPGQVTTVDVTLTPVAEGEEPTVELVGIGAVLGAIEEGLRIADVVEGGGAHEVGLRSGDVIEAIAGEPVDALGFAGSIDRIRGPEGSVVQLRIRRGDAVLDVPTPRRRIRAPME
ncbi:MAG: carboxypeptidase regulatory-like domain-containing protein [Deltaproteobacteria bacterium]|nr:carboxypeptidase regulatory-like domain-containing protein [Deltaproteobacteria bacterium]